VVSQAQLRLSVPRTRALRDSSLSSTFIAPRRSASCAQGLECTGARVDNRRFSHGSQPLVAPATEDRQLNAATVEVLLENAWRIAAAEEARRDQINGKSTSLVAFSSVVVSLTASLGGGLLDRADSVWAFALFLVSLISLVGAIGVALFVLLPRERLTFSTSYIRALPSWGEVSKSPDQVRGETMQGLVRMVERERAINHRNARQTFLAFVLLFFGLLFMTAEAVAEGIVGLT
jgi:hypothetical protein